MPKTKKVKKTKIEEPKEDMPKEVEEKEELPEVYAYGVFDQDGSHFIRAYVKEIHGEKYKELAEGFISKPRVITKYKPDGTVTREEILERSIKELTKEEYDNYEIAHTEEVDKANKETARREQGLPRTQ